MTHTEKQLIAAQADMDQRWACFVVVFRERFVQGDFVRLRHLIDDTDPAHFAAALVSADVADQRFVLALLATAWNEALLRGQRAICEEAPA